MDRRFGIAAGSLICTLAFAASVTAAEKFQKLNGAQVRAKLAGMEVTDDVHWRDVFERNGVLTSFSMGRKSVGKWKVEKDQLCLDRGKDPGNGCYEVWLSGTNVELRATGSSLPLEGRLQRPSGVR
jgi:hypothetical protein